MPLYSERSWSKFLDGQDAKQAHWERLREARKRSKSESRFASRLDTAEYLARKSMREPEPLPDCCEVKGCPFPALYWMHDINATKTATCQQHAQFIDAEAGQYGDLRILESFVSHTRPLSARDTVPLLDSGKWDGFSSSAPGAPWEPSHRLLITPRKRLYTFVSIQQRKRERLRLIENRQLARRAEREQRIAERTRLEIERWNNMPDGHRRRIIHIKETMAVRRQLKDAGYNDLVRLFHKRFDVIRSERRAEASRNMKLIWDARARGLEIPSLRQERISVVQGRVWQEMLALVQQGREL